MIIIVLIIIVVIVLFVLFVVLNTKPTLKKGDIAMEVSVPNPETCTEKAMYAYIDKTPNVVLEQVFKMLLAKGYVVKQEYLDAVKIRLDNYDYSKTTHKTIDISHGESNFVEERHQTVNTRKFSGEDFMRFSSNKIEPEYLRPIKNYSGVINKFTGKKVVITGQLEYFPVRNELAILLWTFGADVDTSISPRIDFVIKGENAGPSKEEKIKELGIICISESDVLDIFPDYQPLYSKRP